jgi:hemoglobin
MKNAMNSEMADSGFENGRHDLDCAEHIDAFVDLFYARLLADPLLKPIFIDVAAIDLAKHLPLIKSYWRKLLLGEREYQRHTMNIHRAVNARHTFTPQAFERWLQLFTQTARDGFEGPHVERAVAVASHIARNMEAALQATAP